jgi:hypothetical protein
MDPEAPPKSAVSEADRFVYPSVSLTSDYSFYKSAWKPLFSQTLVLPHPGHRHLHVVAASPEPEDQDSCSSSDKMQESDHKQPMLPFHDHDGTSISRRKRMPSIYGVRIAHGLSEYDVYLGMHAMFVGLTGQPRASVRGVGRLAVAEIHASLAGS